MQVNSRISGYRWAFILPLLVVLISIFIVYSPVFKLDPQLLSLGVTLDLIFTAPLIYLLLIHNKPINKITVVPWLVGGILLANAIMPFGYQGFARLAMTYVLPLVELTVLTLIGYRVYQLIKTYRSLGLKSPDFLTGVYQSAQRVFGHGLPARLLAWEIAVFYYCFFKWRIPTYHKHQFTYHRKATSKPIFIVLMFVLVVETLVLHLLIQIWSPALAWVLTGLSIYSLFWILAQMKSMAFRPVLVDHGVLYLRNGMAFQAAIPIAKLLEVQEVSSVKKGEGKILSLLPDLETPNIEFSLCEPLEVNGLYGSSIQTTRILMKVDKPQELQACLLGLMKE